MAAPMLIQTAQHYATKKDKNSDIKASLEKGKSQDKSQAQGQAGIEAKNSIIIDCNTLVTDSDKDLLLQNRRQNRPSQQPDNQKQPDSKKNTVNTSVKKSKAPVKTVKNSNSRTAVAGKNLKQSPVSKLLGNPLITNQLREKQKTRKQTQTISEGAITKRSGFGEKDIQNADIKQVSKESTFGVGNVVLHYRKPRLPNSSDQSSESIIQQELGFLLQTSMDNEQFSSGDFDDQNIETTRTGNCTPIQQFDDVDAGSQKQEKINKQKDQKPDEAAVTNSRQPQKKIDILRQKPLSNLVMKAKACSSFATRKKRSTSPQPTVHTGTTRGRGLVTTRKNKRQQKDPQFQLVGTLKQKVLLMPKKPAYTKMLKKSPWGSTASQMKSNFFVHNSNYFDGANAQQKVAADTFDESLQPTQMHQLITLQNGEMMIRQVDLSSMAQPNMISIDLANMMRPNIEGSQQSQNLHIIDQHDKNQGLIHSPTTRLANVRKESSTSTHKGLLTPQINSKTKNTSQFRFRERQYLDTLQYFNNKDKQSIGADTVRFAEISNSSIPNNLGDDAHKNMAQNYPSFVLKSSINDTHLLQSNIDHMTMPKSLQITEQLSTEDLDTRKHSPMQKLRTRDVINCLQDQNSSKVLVKHPLTISNRLSNGQSCIDASSPECQQKQSSSASETNQYLSIRKNFKPSSSIQESLKMTNQSYSDAKQFSLTPKLPNQKENEDISQLQNVYNSLNSTYNPAADQSVNNPFEHSPTSKRVIFNRRKKNEPKSQFCPNMIKTNGTIGTNESGNMPMPAKFKQSHPKELLEAEQEAARIQKKQDLEEDPINRNKKFINNKKPILANQRQQSKPNDLVPWEDQFDQCFQQKQQNNQKKRKNDLTSQASKGTSSQLIDSFDSKKKQIRKSLLVVNDKARRSVRETQEREMNAIVFDDSETPIFRTRRTSIEEKMFEQLVKSKPSTNEETQQPVVSPINDREQYEAISQEKECHTRKQSSKDAEEKKETSTLPLSMNLNNARPELQQQFMKQVLRESGLSTYHSKHSFLLEEEDIIESEDQRDHRLRMEARGAVLLRDNAQLFTLRTAQLNIKRKTPAIYQKQKYLEGGAQNDTEEYKTDSRQELLKKQQSNQNVIEGVVDQEFEEKYEKYGKFLRGKSWKSPVPKGVENLGVHINNSHLESYFQKYEKK